jgi:hypothetical protein
MDIAKFSVPSVGDEFEFAELGNVRRTKRLRLLGETWSEAPDRSVLQASKSSAQAEGAYRFLNNEAFTYVPIVDAHAEQTYERIAQERTVIVAHDTTEVAYEGEVVREGLSRLRGGDQGFLAHVALAIAGDGSRRPLGVVAFSPWVREEAKTSKKNGRKLSGSDYAKVANKESARWWDTVQEVELRARGASLIHVMDRESDAYPLLAQLQKNGHRFVTRLRQDRVVHTKDQGEEDATQLLKEAVRKLEGLFDHNVPIARRNGTTIPRKNKGFGPRESRVAKLRFAATTLRFKRPRYLTQEPEWLAVNVVHVCEVDPPAGSDPVEWLLATSEAVSTQKQIQAVVEQYRTRWVIEEFFKALKTGCAIEKRQHESYETLLKVVAICLPIAWRLLLLRTLARSMPDEPATAALSLTQVQVLCACSTMKLPPMPTARQAFDAIALLGGHHTSNGNPGWLVLGRGMEYLLTLERGWIAAHKKKSDR